MPCGLQLSERGQAHLVQIQDASERVGDFYRLVDELQGLLGAAEEGLNTQAPVGSEVDVIKQQLLDFKVRPASFLFAASAVLFAFVTSHTKPPPLLLPA